MATILKPLFCIINFRQTVSWPKEYIRINHLRYYTISWKKMSKKKISLEDIYMLTWRASYDTWYWQHLLLLDKTIVLSERVIISVTITISAFLVARAIHATFTHVGVVGITTCPVVYEVSITIHGVGERKAAGGSVGIYLRTSENKIRLQLGTNIVLNLFIALFIAIRVCLCCCRNQLCN